MTRSRWASSAKFALATPLIRRRTSSKPMSRRAFPACWAALRSGSPARWISAIHAPKRARASRRRSASSGSSGPATGRTSGPSRPGEWIGRFYDFFERRNSRWATCCPSRSTSVTVSTRSIRAQTCPTTRPCSRGSHPVVLGCCTHSNTSACRLPRPDRDTWPPGRGVVRRGCRLACRRAGSSSVTPGCPIRPRLSGPG